MKSILSLPDNWVYVGYADGTYENVANTDTLSRAEADAFRSQWERARGKHVKTVVLLTPEHHVVKRFNYGGK